MMARARMVIGRVTLHGGTDGEMATPATRLRVDEWLRVANLCPPGLPAGGVLIVRALRVRLDLHGSAANRAPDTYLTGEMTRLLQHAARPAHGAVPANAASVRFADAAELLACLTRDVLRGEAGMRWYWRQEMRERPYTPRASLKAAWCARAEWLPAALAQLTPREAVTAIALLSPEAVDDVLRALHVAFTLPVSTLAPPMISTPRTMVADAAHPSSTPPPWRPWLPDTVAPLPPRPLYLRGLTATLHHAPAVARSQAFARQTAMWLSTASTASTMPVMPAAPAQPVIPSQAPPATRPIAPADGSVTAAPPPSPRLPFLFPRDSISDETRTAAILPAPSSTLPTVAVNDTYTHSRTSIADTASDTAPNAAISPAPLTPPFLGEDGVPTALGGVLFLVRLLAWLDLPCGWDDGGLAAGIGGWGIVEAWARFLLGATLAEHGNDPVWAVLAALDGRAPGTPLGMRLTPTDAFRLPAAWLRRFAPVPLRVRVTTRRDRIALIDATAGYLVADLPLGEHPPADVAQAAVAAYQSVGVTAVWDGTISPTPARLIALKRQCRTYLSAGAAWWLARMGEFTRYVLACALGDAALSATAVAALLLHRQGRIVASRTHVDLVLPLTAATAPVRCAGLDIDPGWAPDLGRIILFHYT